MTTEALGFELSGYDMTSYIFVYSYTYRSRSSHFNQSVNMSCTEAERHAGIRVSTSST